MVVTLDKLTNGLSDNTELFEMSKADGDMDGLQAIADDAATLEADIKQLEFRRMFNNPADPLNAFVDIQAGAGGTEACDWASMSWLVEQAGGAATNGKQRILELQPTKLHERVSVMLGSRNEVERLTQYHAEKG